MAIFVGDEVFRAAAFRAFDAAIDRHSRDCLLPFINRQIAALEQEFRNRDKIDPAVFHPGGHVTAEFSCGFGRGRSATEVRRRAHREHQPATEFASNLVEHFANSLDQRIHLCDTFVGRTVFEEPREAVEVEFDTVAVIAPDGFLD